jgi:hypothetical protein
MNNKGIQLQVEMRLASIEAEAAPVPEILISKFEVTVVNEGELEQSEEMHWAGYEVIEGDSLLFDSTHYKRKPV